MNEIRDDIADLQQRQNSIKFAEISENLRAMVWAAAHKTVAAITFIACPGQAIRASISNAATTAQPRHIRLSRSSPHWPEWRKNMEKHEHYTYRITWSAEEREYVGLCAEFPSLSWLAATRTGALEGIEKVVSETIADMLTQGETPPQALAEKNFSGKLVLRMTPEQHRRLAIGAMEEGVSLNRYLCARLAG
ncbi:hypothetical protein AI2618V1_4821 [Serratia marcescens]|nr:hypothetical protein AI2618V1_4821 [Serratia marcescens]CAE7348681.1 hypothetical protein AI2617V1_4889 [Serratia marcescens]CAH3933264.1 hypothetical protein AI2618V1_4821 [Serratia marcescens]CAH4021150.1 hypothetical protein AI2617V1_4889 [Serratia marcescens]CAI1672390.1 Uncharacterized protein encoded in hypervariable junctions of pilus gene clusters [Serratia marcescens]